MYYLVVWWLTQYLRSLKKGDMPYVTLYPETLRGPRLSIHNTLQSAERMAQQLADAYPNDMVNIYTIDSERVTPYTWEPQRNA